MKSAAINVKMYVSLLKIRRYRLPNSDFRVDPFDLAPCSIADSFAEQINLLIETVCNQPVAPCELQHQRTRIFNIICLRYIKPVSIMLTGLLVKKIAILCSNAHFDTSAKKITQGVLRRYRLPMTLNTSNSPCQADFVSQFICKVFILGTVRKLRTGSITNK